MRASGALVFLLGACTPSQTTQKTPADAAAETAEPGLFEQDSGLDAPDDAGPPHVDDLPTVDDFGGPTLANPTIVPVFFANEDPMRQSVVTAFLGKLPGSAYWAATTKEY